MDRYINISDYIDRVAHKLIRLLRRPKALLCDDPMVKFSLRNKFTVHRRSLCKTSLKRKSKCFTRKSAKTRAQIHDKNLQKVIMFLDYIIILVIF